MLQTNDGKEVKDLDVLTHEQFSSLELSKIADTFLGGTIYKTKGHTVLVQEDPEKRTYLIRRIVKYV